MRQLIRRETLHQLRDPKEFRVRILRQVIIGLLIIAVFWKLNGNSREEIYGMAGALFFIATNQVMMNLQSAVLEFQLERPIFLREQAEKMYGVAPYYLAKVLVELPVIIVSGVLFSCIVYFGIGLYPNVWAWLRFTFVVLLLGFASSAYGHFISILFNTPETAVAASPIILLPLVILGGFFTNSGNVPSWVGWL